MRIAQPLFPARPMGRFLLRFFFRSSPAPSRSTAEPHLLRFRPGAGKAHFLAAIVAMVSATGVLLGQESSEIKKAPAQKDAPPAAASPGANLSASPAIAAARERAELLHDLYSSTLTVIHDHYFHSELAPVPARAMEDVFDNMAGLYGDKANWISVNTKAMSIDHKPATDFEKKAAAELAAGKKEYELAENGVYQRAAIIPLGTNCIGCHVGRFSTPPKSPRAALVIRIPLKPGNK